MLLGRFDVFRGLGLCPAEFLIRNVKHERMLRPHLCIFQDHVIRHRAIAIPCQHKRFDSVVQLHLEGVVPFWYNTLA